MQDDKLTNKLDVYEKAYSQNKNVDIASLSMDALNAQSSNIPYSKIYLLSILIPPFAGVYYAIKYFFGLGDTYEDKTVAFVSLILTIVSLFITIWISEALLNSLLPATSSPDQMLNNTYNGLY